MMWCNQDAFAASSNALERSGAIWHTDLLRSEAIPTELERSELERSELERSEPFRETFGSFHVPDKTKTYFLPKS